MGIEYEKKTVGEMIRLFCRRQHCHGGTELCSSCAELLAYAENRLSKCKFGDEKPQCKHCPVHCYSPKMRERISEVMKYSGPRMLFVHPVMAVRHFFNRRKPARR